VRAPGTTGRLELVHLVEIDRVGEIAMVLAPTTVRRDPTLRRELASYLRYIADYRVAPWQRWPKERSRREAFLLYVRTIAGQRPAVARLAAWIRQLLPLNRASFPAR
jgi:hypothetical protein